MVIIEVYGAKVEKMFENPMPLTFFNLHDSSCSSAPSVQVLTVNA